MCALVLVLQGNIHSVTNMLCAIDLYLTSLLSMYKVCLQVLEHYYAGQRWLGLKLATASMTHLDL